MKRNIGIWTKPVFVETSINILYLRIPTYVMTRLYNYCRDAYQKKTSQYNKMCVVSFYTHLKYSKELMKIALGTI